ncbi:MAG: hypothetical protein N4A54_09065 [Peptostreptococcaceae bacterium]|jgi:hypothetical protein|nr:hypothetical protein [Peptostreptococcaceae bacterium]
MINYFEIKCHTLETFCDYFVVEEKGLDDAKTSTILHNQAIIEKEDVKSLIILTTVIYNYLKFNKKNSDENLSELERIEKIYEKIELKKFLNEEDIHYLEEDIKYIRNYCDNSK